MNSMLDNLVFSHPFPALIAFFLVIGLFYLGTLFAFKYFNGIPSLIESVSVDHQVLGLMQIGYLY